MKPDTDYFHVGFVKNPHDIFGHLYSLFKPQRTIFAFPEERFKRGSFNYNNGIEPGFDGSEFCDLSLP